MICLCKHPKEQHGEVLAKTGAVRRVVSGCKVEGCACEKYRPRPAESAKLSEDEKALGRWLILQHKRMIHEIRQRYGIQE